MQYWPEKAELRYKEVTLAIASSMARTTFGFAEKQPIDGQPDPMHRVSSPNSLFIGIVHQEWRSPPTTKPIRAHVRIYEGSNPIRPYFGESHLSAENDDEKYRQMSTYNHQLQLSLRVFDRQGEIIEKLQDAMIEGAISGIRFVHVTVTFEEKELSVGLAGDPLATRTRSRRLAESAR